VNPAFERESLERLGDVEACFRRRIEYPPREFGARVRDRTFDDRLEGGLAHVSGRLRAMSESALRVARDERAMPTTPLDCDTEVGLVALEMVPIFAALPYWIAREGLGFALRALAATHVHWSSAKDQGYGGDIWIMNDETHAHRMPEYADSAWRLVRGVLAAADDATYAAARETARALRESAHPVVRSMLAFAFTTERDWADEAAKDALARGPRASGYENVLVTVASLDLAAVLAKMWWEQSDAELFTLLMREGATGASVVAAALDTASNNAHRKRYANILATVQTEGVAETFSRYIANKTVGPIAMKFFERNPELTRRALEPLAHGSSMQARGAAMVLRALAR
jgi:hypothetical protein